ncbi:type IV leader peptidase family protein [archaeon]|nr:type IV leader peptidase family protein [archaeon]
MPPVNIHEIEYLKIFVTLLVLLYASILDYKYREIDNKSWLSLVALGFIFNIYEFFISGSYEILKFLIISSVSGLLVAYVLYYTGAMGGGDGKIFMGIAAMFPLFPFATFSLFPLFFLSVFANSVFLSAFLPLIFFIKNIPNIKGVKSLKEVVLLFIGYKREEKDVKEFEAVIARDDKINIFQNANLMELGTTGKSTKEVWVTPALPFIIPITLGFILSLVYGDIVTWIVLRVM